MLEKDGGSDTPVTVNWCLGIITLSSVGVSHLICLGPGGWNWDKAHNRINDINELQDPYHSFPLLHPSVLVIYNVTL